MTEKLNEQQLLDFALSQVPLTGEIVYSELRDKIRASANPEAVAMLPELKRRGYVTGKVVANPDNTIRHTYARKQGV